MKDENLIIDIPTSNVGSIKNIIAELGYEIKVSSNIEDIKKSKRIILPGHGTFIKAKDFLVDKGIFSYLTKINKNQLFLGICVGMQLLAEYSHEEKKTTGLNLIHGEVKKILLKNNEKLPHIGWNQIIIKKNDCKLLSNLTHSETLDAYFSHSYSFNLKDKKDLVCSTPFGKTNISSIVQLKNIFGVQFHPEKSSYFGRQVLKNFLELN